MKLSNPFFGFRNHFFPGSIPNRLSGAGFSTRGLFPILQPVVTHGALLGDSGFLLCSPLSRGRHPIRTSFNNPEGASRHTHPASVANIILNHNSAVLTAE